jgi:hypothetical protein
VTDVAAMLREARGRIMYGLLRDRFGAVACRIVRLLHAKRMLEQKQAGSPAYHGRTRTRVRGGVGLTGDTGARGWQVGSLAMVPAAEARTQLYQMMSAGFVSVQVRAGTRTASYPPIILAHTHTYTHTHVCID